jgi:hypothetical protein
MKPAPPSLHLFAFGVSLRDMAVFRHGVRSLDFYMIAETLASLKIIFWLDQHNLMLK